MPVIAGIEDALASAEVLVFLCNVRDDPERERTVIASLLAKQVDGIIAMGRRTDVRPPLILGRSATPVVYAFSSVEDGSALCFLPDDAQGARLATEHLLALGRRRFAHVTGPAFRDAAIQRHIGVQQALSAHGIELREDLTIFGDWTEAAGYEAVERVLALQPETDAIVCGADIIARGAIDALRERGKQVPEEIAVVGFDNWEIIAEAARPPLTTVDMNLHELGFEAGQRLLAQVDGDREAGIIRLPCSLVVRESCGATARSGQAPR
jgi:LacI family transcriptional regulator